VAPIALLYAGFGHFEDFVHDRTTSIPGQDRVKTVELELSVNTFGDCMQLFFPDEAARRVAALPELNAIFNSFHDIQKMPPVTAAQIGGVTSDGHSDAPTGAAALMVEFKNETTGISADPNVQVVSYVAHSNKHAMDKFPKLYEHWRVPALAITIIGP
jgi:hypothetical protein